MTVQSKEDTRTVAENGIQRIGVLEGAVKTLQSEMDQAERSIQQQSSSISAAMTKATLADEQAETATSGIASAIAAAAEAEAAAADAEAAAEAAAQDAEEALAAISVSDPVAATAITKIYVRTGGSDTTGNGSVGNPYATLRYAIQQVPLIIPRNACYIVDITGCTETFTNTFSLPAFKGTSPYYTNPAPDWTGWSGTYPLVIQAVPTVLDTLTSPSSSADAISNLYSYTQAGKTWTPNAFVGKMVVGGSYTGCIASNTADTIEVCCPWEMTGTLTIFEPGATLTTSSSSYNALYVTPGTNCGIVFRGINFLNPGANYYNVAVNMQNPIGYIGFVSCTIGGMYMFGAGLRTVIDSCYFNTKTLSIDGFNVMLRFSYLKSLADSLTLKGTNFFTTGNIYDGCKAIGDLNGQTLSAFDLEKSDIRNGTGNGIELRSGCKQIIYKHKINCVGYGIYAIGPQRVEATQIGGTVSGAYGIVAEDGAHVNVSTTCTITGTVGPYKTGNRVGGVTWTDLTTYGPDADGSYQNYRHIIPSEINDANNSVIGRDVWPEGQYSGPWIGDASATNGYPQVDVSAWVGQNTGTLLLEESDDGLSGWTTTETPTVSDAIIDTVTVGAQPMNICIAGPNVWVVNSTDETVTKVLAADGSVLGTYASGSTPQGILFDGTNIWVSNGAARTVRKILEADGSHIGTYTAGTTNSAADMAFDGTYLWVLSPGSSSKIVKILAADGSTVNTYSVAGGVTTRVIIHVAPHIWIAGDHFIRRYLTATGALDGSFTTGVGHVAGLVYDGTYVWSAELMTDYTTKAVKRMTDGTVIGSYPTHTFGTYWTPSGICYDGTYIWVVSSAAGSVSNIRQTDGTLISVRWLNSGLSDINFDGSYLWIAEGPTTNLYKFDPGPQVDITHAFTKAYWRAQWQETIANYITVESNLDPMNTIWLNQPLHGFLSNTKVADLTASTMLTEVAGPAPGSGQYCVDYSTGIFTFHTDEVAHQVMLFYSPVAFSNAMISRTL